MEILILILISVIAILSHKILELKSKLKKPTQTSEAELPGYSRFLEDSRDAAFSYIEQVQLAIVDYRDKTNSKNKAQIKESYDKLISFLPDEM